MTYIKEKNCAISNTYEVCQRFYTIEHFKMFYLQSNYTIHITVKIKKFPLHNNALNDS